MENLEKLLKEMFENERQARNLVSRNLEIMNKIEEIVGVESADKK